MSYEALLPILWGFFVGVVFTTVGAAGGILAGVGHISLFGIKDANLVKLYNQVLVVLSGLTSSPLYLKQGRVILPLAVLLGAGSVIGALVGSGLSYRYLKELKDYKFLFGILTLLISLKILYDALRGFKAGSSGAFQSIRARLYGPHLELSSDGEVRRFSLLSPFFAGLLIAFVSSALGVGGGFLVIPYMLLILRIPAYFVPGTAVLTVLIAVIASALNYMRLSSGVDFHILGLEMVGMLSGSFLGPHISKRLGERRLRIAIGLLLLYIGVGYTLGDWLKSHLGIRIV